MLGLVLAWITLVLYGSKAAFAGGVLGLLLGFIWVNLVRLRSYSRRLFPPLTLPRPLGIWRFSRCNPFTRP
jgi:hypothetical protein